MKRLKRENINTLKWWEDYYSFKLDKIPSQKRTEDVYRFVSKYIKDKGTLLDIGCGYGWGSNLIKKYKNNLNITGIDFSSISIKKAKESSKDISFETLDIVKDNISQKYNYILLIEILEHLEKPFDVIDKCLKICTDRLFITVPNRPRRNEPEITHINIFDIEDFRSRYDNVCLVRADKHLKIFIDKTFDPEKWKSINGWCREAEGQFLEQLAIQSPIGKTIEIGSYQGKSAIRIGRVRAVTCVDNFNTGAFKLEKQGKVEGPFKKMFEQNVKGWPCHSVVSDHAEFLKNFNEDVSFVFVDGSHFYALAKRDIFGWYKKLIKGGIIAIHDSPYPEVKKAINEFRRTFNPKFMGSANATIGFMKCE